MASRGPVCVYECVCLAGWGDDSVVDGCWWWCEWWEGERGARYFPSKSKDVELLWQEWHLLLSSFNI